MDRWIITSIALAALALAGCGDEARRAPDGGSDARAADVATQPEAAPEPPPPDEGVVAQGMAKSPETVIYSEADARSRKVGVLRWGATFEVGDGAGGSDGWVRMKGVGWLKSDDVITRRKGPPVLKFIPVAPNLEEPLPFRYARVTADELPVYRRPPKRGEDPQRAFMRNLKMNYFFTIDQWVNIYDREMYRTTRYWFIPREGTETVSLTPFSGVEVTPETELPFLWVTDPTAKLCASPRPANADGGLDCPAVERHLRLPYFEKRESNGPWYRTKGNQWVPALQVAYVDRVKARPREVGPDERWIYVDLRNQFAALYEGDRMVFVTLVSSGDEGHETPPGTYRLEAKHISTTMDNEENPSGPYMIQDVPWVMYFKGSYALHGAFWHDRFGLKTSHGCVNLAPADARRFFNFATSPELPAGWHAVFTPPGTKGTLVHITD